MASVLRYKIFTTLRNAPRTCFLLKTKNLCVTRPAAKVVPANASKKHGQMSIHQCLLLLEKKIQTIGRLTGFDLDCIVESVRNKANLETNQVLLLIKCCGSIAVNEPPASRMAYAQKVWDSVKASGTELDISHYNVFLKIQIENEEPISPFNYLKTIEDNGLVPNRITYQYLLTYCCLKGDLAKATKILEEMNNRKFPLNENIFNSLVLGHCVAGDVTSAEGVLNIMREKGIFITSITYSMFLCGLAMSGNIEKMKSLIEECSKQNIELPDNKLMDVAYYLFINGHGDYAVEFLSRFWKRNHVQDIFTLQYRLLQKKHYEDYLSTLEFLKAEKGVADLIRLALRYLGNKEDFESILKFKEACDKKGVDVDVMKQTLYYSLRNYNIEKSFKIIGYLHKSGHQMKEAYFAPLAVQAATKNADDVFRVINFMSCDYSFDVRTEFLCHNIFRHLDMTENQINFFLDGISQYVPRAVVFNAFIRSCLRKRDIYKYGNVLNRHRFSFKFFEDTINEMVRYLNQKGDPVDIANIMVKWVEENRPEVNVQSSGSDHEDSFRKNIKETIHKLASKIHRNCENDIAQNFLKVAESRKLPMYAEEFYRLTQGAQKTPRSSTSTESGEADVEEQPETADVEEQTETADVEEQTVDDGGSNLFYQLSKLKQAGNVTELEKLFDENEELQNENGFRSIVRAMKHLNKNDLVMKYLKKYYEKFSQNNGDMSRYLYLEAEMLNRGMVKEAITLIEKRQNIFIGTNFILMESFIAVIEKLKEDDLKKILNVPSSSSYKLIPIVKIFNILTWRGLEEAAIKILGVLEAENIKNNSVCTILTTSLFNKKKFELMDELIKFFEGHPARKEFFCDLIFLYACSGNITKGREFLNAVQLAPLRWNVNISKFIKEIEETGQAKVLENMIAIVKGYELTQKSELYEYLMERYNQDSVSPDKALDLWLQMQEDNIQPSSMFLITLAKILRRNKREVPFVVPTNTRSHKIELPKSIPADIRYALLEVSKNPRISALIVAALKRRLRQSDIEFLLKENENIDPEKKAAFQDLLSLLKWKEAYYNGELMSHLKKVIESTDSGRKDKNIPIQFLARLLVSLKRTMSISSSQIALWAYVQNYPEYNPLFEILDPTVQKLIKDESALVEIVTLLTAEPLTNNITQIVTSLLSQNVFDKYDYIKRTAEDILNAGEKKILEPDENKTAFISVLESKSGQPEAVQESPDSEKEGEEKIFQVSDNAEVVPDRTSGTGPNV